ncbi:MAG: hypothetical protein LBQ54_03830, partial [Planctomycetaceae bacterium]|nr:hypothetical protein [Planctomycetaceae bacterium]
MMRKQYALSLFSAIRETLENMAFAEVVPYSMLVGEDELIEEVRKGCGGTAADSPAGWGEPEPSAEEEAEEGAETESEEIRGRETSPQNLDAEWMSSEDDAWGVSGPESVSVPENGLFGESPAGSGVPFSGGAWEHPLDAWGEPETLGAEDPENAFAANRDVDFDQLIRQQEGWCWSCLKLNSAELDSVWFVVPQSLLLELAKTMYAGETFEMDTPLVRDIIAEITNVIGGRLMLLLEDVIGKFTLEVPKTGFGMPDFSERNTQNETIVCKVLVDGAYPVMTTMCFLPD